MTTQASQSVREVSGLSPDPRVRVFRRVLEDFDGMEVDSYVVLGSSHAIFLDTLTSPADMAQVMTLIKPDLDHRQVLCVNSHADWDHCWGNNFFTAPQHISLPAQTIPILAHEYCRQRLLSPEAQSRLDGYKKSSAAFSEVTLVPPTLTFREQLTIAAGDLTVELLHAPGHCPDQIVAWLPEIHLLLAFDAVERPLPSIDGSSCVPLMFSSLQRLAALDARTVLCSHGNSHSPDLIHENLAYLNEIERRARLLLQQRVPADTELEQAATLVNYPFDEVIAHLNEEIDRAYYSSTHEQNVQAILTYLRSNS
ncbi:MAG TPA: MBL fold metallo-hydrolase [Ktedonobacteraceae bacterium]